MDDVIPQSQLVRLSETKNINNLKTHGYNLIGCIVFILCSIVVEVLCKVKADLYKDSKATKFLLKLNTQMINVIQELAVVFTLISILKNDMNMRWNKKN